MIEAKILKTAKNLGFAARLNEENYWQILPKKTSETWILTHIEFHWILSIKNVPQIRLNEREVIAFLTLRFSTSNDYFL